MVYKPLIVAGIPFPHVKAAKAHASRILNDGPIGSTVEGADAEFVEHLWLNRPDKLAKAKGRRVVGFERRQWEKINREWTRCFFAVFENGDVIHFSFNKAIKNITDAQHPPN